MSNIWISSKSHVAGPQPANPGTEQKYTEAYAYVNHNYQLVVRTATASTEPKALGETYAYVSHNYGAPNSQAGTASTEPKYTETYALVSFNYA